MTNPLIRRAPYYALGMFRFILWKLSGQEERNLLAKADPFITQLDRFLFYRTVVLPGQRRLALSTLPDGSKIIHPIQPIDMAVLDEIWIDNVYEKDKRIQRGDVVMDCGAHVGTFSIKAARAGARIVVAIEPDPANCALLNRNVRLNKLDNVVVVRAAVGERDESQRTKSYWGKEASASVRTIRSLASEMRLDSLDLVKIDVEGDEVGVMEGAEGVDVRHIAMEYHGELRRTQVERLLRRKGYDTLIRQATTETGYIYARILGSYPISQETTQINQKNSGRHNR